MAETDLSDDLSEWEQIQSPFSHTRPSHHQSTSPRQIDDDHQSLPLSPPPQDLEPRRSPALPPPQEPNSPSPSSSSSSPTPESPPVPPSSSSSRNSKRDEEATRRRSDSRLVAAREIGKRLRLRLGILSAEVLRAASKVCNYWMIAGRFWSVVSVVGVLTAMLLSLLYVKLKPRWRTRRLLRDDKERLILLLKEKDEISQLLVQIAEMNEALSARRRVPVLRVG
ncbi:CASP-like protein 4A1 isoform X2 [Morus notabilis]|uniref:CASP-like protein 4A1 isoform X2 n=1 Tax=Morus notabilis TaxID=981085 RepID=UPI000CED57BE|nr:CASP-like protein 4A1 isoform X2 [Morus notabilis]